MKKYKAEYERNETGYVEVFADDEDDAIAKLYKQKPLSEIMETEDWEFTNAKQIK